MRVWRFTMTVGTESRCSAGWANGISTMCPRPAGDLGGRMFQSLRSAFGRGARRVVLVGTDIPRLAPAHLEAAFKRLGRHDLVIGPLQRRRLLAGRHVPFGKYFRGHCLECRNGIWKTR